MLPQEIPNFIPGRTTHRVFEMEHGFLPNFIPPKVKLDFLPADLQQLLVAQRMHAAAAAPSGLPNPAESAPVENAEPAVAVDVQEQQPKAEPEAILEAETQVAQESASEPVADTTPDATTQAVHEAAPEPIASATPETLDAAAAMLAARKEIADALGQTQASAPAVQRETEEVLPAAAFSNGSTNGMPPAPTTNNFSSQVPAGHQAAGSGLQTLSEGGLGLIGGLSSLIGNAGRAAGHAAHHLANEIGKRSATRNEPSASPDVAAEAPSVSSLPKVSTFRVSQAEKMANSYETAMNEFWQSGRLPEVRRAIEEHARTTGASVPDVMAKMVPGGELEGLRASFIDASNDPEAQEKKEAMDRSLKGWLNQYGRGCEELITSTAEDTPEHESLQERFEKMRKKMTELAAETPKFPGEDQSHAERLREAIDRIVERVKEMVRSVIDFSRGHQNDQSPSAGM